MGLEGRKAPETGAQTPGEVKLVKLCKAGDEAAREELVHAHSGRLFRIAYHLLGDYETALDIVQDSFLRFFEGIDKIDPKRGVSAWLNRVAVNLTIDALRKKKRNGVTLTLRTETEGPGREPSEISEKERLRKDVWAAIDKLPEKYRVPLVMREIERMSSKDISKALKCNEATARWRIHRARRLFREAWKEQGESGRYLVGEEI